jgi:hypothetical protein
MSKLFWGLLILVVGLELVSLVLVRGSGRNQMFAPESLDAITDGMDEADVVKILGPPGNYTTSASAGIWKPGLSEGRLQVRKLAQRLSWTYREWLDDKGGVVILLDDKAKVAWKFHQSVHGKGIEFSIGHSR